MVDIVGDQRGREVDSAQFNSDRSRPSSRRLVLARLGTRSQHRFIGHERGFATVTGTCFDVQLPLAYTRGSEWIRKRIRSHSRGATPSEP